jgi:hypothetical protein
MVAKQAGRQGNAGRERYNTASRASVHATVDVSLCDALRLATIVEGVTALGDCIMFSRTSDGGALHIRVLSEGTVAKWYPSTQQELEEVLSGLSEDLHAENAN